MTESEGTFELPLVRCCTASLRTSTTASEFLFFSFGNFVGDVRVKFVVHFDESAEMILINLETFLLQVGGSCNAGRDVRLNVLNYMSNCLKRSWSNLQARASEIACHDSRFSLKLAVAFLSTRAMASATASISPFIAVRSASIAIALFFRL